MKGLLTSLRRGTSLTSLGLSPGMGGGGGPAPDAYTLYNFKTGVPAVFNTLVTDGQRLSRKSTGKWGGVSANAARLHHSSFLNPLGCVFEKSSVDLTTLKTNPTADPTAGGGWNTSPVGFWTKQDAVDLAGSGYEDVFSTVYRGSNATGADVSYGYNAGVGTVEKVSIQTLMNDRSGAGASPSRVRLSSGSVATISALGSWERLTIENETPTTISRIAQITLRANRTAVDLAYLQMSRAPYCPFPLLHPVDGVAITTANEYASALVSALTNWSTSEVALAFEWYHEWPFTTDNEPIFAIAKASSPTTDYLRIVGMADGTMKIEMVIASATIFSMTFAAPTRRTVCRAAVRLKSGSFLAAVNGVEGTVDTDAGDWSGLDTVYVNRLGSAYSNVIARSIELEASHLTDSQIVAASAPNEEGFI